MFRKYNILYLSALSFYVFIVVEHSSKPPSNTRRFCWLGILAQCWTLAFLCKTLDLIPNMTHKNFLFEGGVYESHTMILRGYSRLFLESTFLLKIEEIK